MKGDSKDVGFLDDAIFLLSNMIAAENHCIQSYCLSKDTKWIDILIKLRRNRSKRMYSLIQKSNDERYCICKHLLACSESLRELGNRHTEEEEEDLAKECFEESVLYESLVKLLMQGGKNEKSIQEKGTDTKNKSRSFFKAKERKV